jgi:hypothetical protein
MSGERDFADAAAAATSPEGYLEGIRDAMSAAPTVELPPAPTAPPEPLDLVALARAAATAERAKVREQLRTYSAADWSKPAPPEPALFELDTRDGSKLWLPRHEVGLLTATGGAGKTATLAALVLSVATGRAAFGALRPQRTGRVLFVTAEETPERMRGRIADAARADLNLDNNAPLPAEVERALADRVTLAKLSGPLLVEQSVTEGVTREQAEAAGVAFTFAAGGSIRRTSSVPSPLLAELRAYLEEPTPEPWALVVFDPLARFHTGEENDNAAAARLVGALESLRDTRDRPAVIVAHHTSKGSTDARGASAFRDNTRWRATVGRLPDLDGADEKARALTMSCRTLTVERNSYGPEAPAMPPLYLVGVSHRDGFALRRETSAEQQARASAVAAATSGAKPSKPSLFPR